MDKRVVKLIIPLFLCWFSALYIFAQHHEHEHSRNEIGFSGGALYAFEHNEWGSGIHLHYYRTLKLHSKWSIGASIEQAWADGSHFNTSAGVKYQLLDRLSISAQPGVSFIAHNKTDAHNTNEPRKTLFTLHFELVYDLFHWENFHLGTVVDYSRKKSDQHAMLGIHAAFCF